MKDYTSEAPIWSDTIPVVEENDLVNAENNNAAAIQLLQNILVLAATKVNKEEGKSLVSETERNLWNMIYQQATGYTDQKIADLIGGAPSTLDTLEKIAAAMADNADVVAALNSAIGSKANQSEMESLLGTKLEKTGDSKDNTVTFTSSDTLTPSGWTDIAVLKSGETHKSFAQKMSTMFKNLRYLKKLLGSTDISAIGDGTVTGALNSLNTGRNYVRLTLSWYNEQFIELISDSFCEKINNIAHIYLHFRTKSDFDMTSALFLLPEGFRPKTDFYQAGILFSRHSQSYNGESIPFCKIMNTGHVAIFAENGDWILINANFVCE